MTQRKEIFTSYMKDDGHEGHFCLECGDEMVYGRPDRKFCSKTCKNKYHNRRHVRKRNFKLRIEHILGKNYKVLTQLISSGITAIPFSGLSALGFNPLYSTCSYKQGRHNVNMCYDISYNQTSSRIYGLQYIEEMPGVMEV